MASLNQVELSNGENFSSLCYEKEILLPFPSLWCSHGARHWKFHCFPFAREKNIGKIGIYWERERAESTLREYYWLTLLSFSRHTRIYTKFYWPSFCSAVWVSFLSSIFWAFIQEKLLCLCVSDFFRDSEPTLFHLRWMERKCEIDISCFTFLIHSIHIISPLLFQWW